MNVNAEPRDRPRGEYPRLIQFLASPERPEGTLSDRELRGFLYAVVCAPVAVLPRDCMPLIFGGATPGFESIAQARAVSDDLTSLFVDIVCDTAGGEPALPEHCRFRPRLLSNFDEGAPVRRWARGFTRGHFWLEEFWLDYVAEQSAELLGVSVMMLSFFADRRLAAEYARRSTAPGTTLEAAAEFVHRRFEAAMKIYASLGQANSDVLDRSVPALRRATSWRARRRAAEFCHCGSRQPHNLCCGARLH